MRHSQNSSQATRSHDAVIEEFLRELDGARDEDTIANLLARAVASHPERADELGALAAGFKNLRGMRDPERLGQYRIRRVLAVGGMGKLYEAEEDELHRIVAVKTIKFGRIAEPHLLDRFDRERRTLARLHHTNIVPIYAAGQEAELLYFSMPRIHGPSLRAVIKVASTLPGAASSPPSASTFEQLVDEASAEEVKEHASRAVTEVEGSRHPEVTESANGRPSPLNVPRDYRRRVAALMADVAEAVHHAHQAGVIHRDLKPGNILVERQGHPWVLDFGLAHFQGEVAPSPAIAETNGDTDPGGPTVGVGTPLYWAPEQVPPSRRPPDADPPPAIDHRTDIWGLGATLYELLTLRRPFTRVEQILSKPPPAPNRIVASFPRELSAICSKALEKDPNDRYPTARALADDLHRWLEVRPTAAGEAAIRRKSNRLLGWTRVWLRRLGFWSRRRPAAAGLVMTFVLIGGLVTAYAAHVNQLKLHNAYAEAETTKAKLQVTEQRVELTKSQLAAAQREQRILELPQRRRPVRKKGWYEESRQIVRSLRGDSTKADEQLQSHAAAALEGIDAQVEKSLPGGVGPVTFDPSSKTLLMIHNGVDGQRRPWSRTILWERATQRTLVERDLGDGVPAFRSDGTPLQLSSDRNDPARLHLYEVRSGTEVRAFRVPLAGAPAPPLVALSRDGSRLAATESPTPAEKENLVAERDRNRRIAVWDAASEQPIKTLEHKATEYLVLSPDGRLLAAWDVTGEITVWTLPDGKRLPPFRVGRCPVSCLAFGRDPVWREDDSIPPWLLAVAESSGLVTVWDLTQNRPRSVCRGSEFGVWAMDFSADGVSLLTAGRHAARLWDMATGTCLLDLNIGDFCQSVSFAADGRHCAFSLSNSGNGAKPGAYVVELELGHGIRTLHGLRGVVERTAFSPDGRLIAAVSHEWDVGLWEQDSGRLLGVLPAPIGRFADSIGMAFDPGGRRFACSVGREARLWDLEQHRMIDRWNLPEGLCDSIAFSGDRQLLLARQETRNRQGGPFGAFPPNKYPRTVRLYDLLSPTPTRPLAEIDDFDLQVHQIAIAPNGSVFAVDGVGTDQGKPRRKFHLYQGPIGRLLRAFPTTREPGVHGCIRFDPTSKVLLASLETMRGDGRPTLFDLPGMEYRGAPTTPVGCLSPDAKWSMAWTEDRTLALALYDLATGLPFMRIAQDVEFRQLSFSFSPDGRHTIVGRRDGTVLVLDLVEINRQLTKLNLGW
jgi:serine/threonine protein kinase/WD40 repeat protein